MERRGESYISVALNCLAAHDHGGVLGEALRVLIVGGGVVGDFVKFAKEGGYVWEDIIWGGGDVVGFGHVGGFAEEEESKASEYTLRTR
jgi:hypothetical protein